MDNIELTDDEYLELERLSALRYSIFDMAMYFDKPLDLFKQDAKTDGCKIHYHIRRGKLIIRANADMQLMAAAEGGNVTAIEQLNKLMAKQDYKEMLNDLSENEL